MAGLADGGLAASGSLKILQKKYQQVEIGQSTCW